MKHKGFIIQETTENERIVFVGERKQRYVALKKHGGTND